MYVPRSANKHAATREKKVQHTAQADGPPGDARPFELFTPNLASGAFKDPSLLPISGFVSSMSLGCPPN
jgi:hypothetical protein